MAKVKFNVTCMATYKSELEIPDEIKNNDHKILKYIRSHLNDCAVDEIEWLDDLEPEDAVNIEDIRYVL